MRKTTREQKEKLKDVLSQDRIEKTNLADKEIAEMVGGGMNKHVVYYWRCMWGFHDKKKGVPRKNRQSQKNLFVMSLDQAIEICKQNGLKVTREKLTVEEL